MAQFVRSFFAHWFGLGGLNFKKRLASPRESLCEVERRLSGQLKTHFRHQRRAD